VAVLPSAHFCPVYILAVIVNLAIIVKLLTSHSLNLKCRRKEPHDSDFVWDQRGPCLENKYNTACEFSIEIT